MPDFIQHIQPVQLPALNEKLFIATNQNQNPTGMRIFDVEAKVRGETQSIPYCYSIVLKDNLKLFASSRTVTTQLIFRMQADALKFFVFVPRPYSIPAFPNNIAHCSLDDPSSNFIFVANKDSVWRVDLAAETTGTITSLSSPRGITCLRIFSRSGSILIGFEAQSLQIVNRATFAPLKIPTLSAMTVFLQQVYEQDNLNERYLFSRNDQRRLYKFDLQTSFTGSATTVSAQLSIVAVTANTASNHLLNFGSHQLLVHMPCDNNVELSVLFVNKLSFQFEMVGQIKMPKVSPVSYGQFLQTSMSTSFHQINDRYYFGISHRFTDTNFQTYYLLFDNCTSRVNDICETCPDGTFKTNLTIHNRCLHPDNFPEAHGVNPYSLTIDQCGVGCKGAVLQGEHTVLTRA